MKKLHRKKSKRVSLRQKHKIVKRASEAKKKLRKEARRMSRQGIKKTEKKDPGIPNLCPQKKELLQELQFQKNIEIEHKQEIKKKSNEQKQNDEFTELRNVKASFKQDNSLEALISSSDLLIEVLDSRDPHPSPYLESINLSKPRIFVLNKSDLVPSDIVDKWHQYLSKISPCFIFQIPVDEKLKEALLGYIRTLGKSTLGIVGYPNVGKSSLINALKGYKIAPVTKLPGGTKKIEEYEINLNIKVLDSPGIERHDTTPTDILRAIVGIENLQDPYTPVQGILEKVNKEKLLVLYAIPEFKDIKEFLTHVARKTGKIAKGGLPDYDSAAKIVLHDWFTMKISFYTPIN